MEIKNFFNSILQGILILDRDFNIVAYNKNFLNLYNIKEENITKRKCFNIFKKDEICEDCPVKNKIFNKIIHRFFTNKSIEIKVSPINNSYFLLEYFETEKFLKLFEKNIEEKKFAEIGHISAAIAHKVNNILTVIIGKLETINIMKDVGKLTQNYLDDSLKLIEEKSNEIKKLMDELLHFAHPERIKKVKKNLNQIIREFYIFSKYEIERPSVEFSLDLGEIEEIYVDETLITLMLLNLCRILSRNFVNVDLEKKELIIFTSEREDKIFIIIKDNNIKKAKDIEKLIANIFELKYENFIIRYALIFHNAEIFYEFEENKGNKIEIVLKKK